MRRGFDFYDTTPRIGGQTTKEILAGMTARQKAKVLTAFKLGIGKPVAARRVLVSKEVIEHLYGKIREAEAMARAYMRGEVVVPGDPPVYNTPPSTASELIAVIKDSFVKDFTEGQVIAILTAMANYSKHDGSGTWAYYKVEVVK